MLKCYYIILTFLNLNFGVSLLSAVQRSAYDGTQFMRFSSTEQQQSEGEDISMRFKTTYCQGFYYF